MLNLLGVLGRRLARREQKAFSKLDEKAFEKKKCKKWYLFDLLNFAEALGRRPVRKETHESGLTTKIDLNGKAVFAAARCAAV